MKAKEFTEKQFEKYQTQVQSDYEIFTKDEVEAMLKEFAEMKCKEKGEICASVHVPLGTDYNIHQERETIKNAKQPEL